MTTWDRVRPLSVAIVEDRALVVDALVSRLREAGIESRQAVAAVEQLDPSESVDVILCCLDQGGDRLSKSAIDLLARSGQKVLAMSQNASPEPVLDSIGSGARGYLENGSAVRDLEEAVRAVAGGGHHLSACLARYLLEDSRCRPLSHGEIGPREVALLESVAAGQAVGESMEALELDAAGAQALMCAIFETAVRRRQLHRLAPRETEVLVLVGCAGLSQTAAAARIGIRPIVVAAHLREIKRKYLATHPGIDEAIAPKAAAHQWAIEQGLC